MKNIRFYALALSLVLVGCSSIQDRVDTTRTANIKKVAIIGFDINQKMPADNLGIAAFTDLVNTDTTVNAPEMKKMAVQSYQTLCTTIEKTTGWKVMTVAEMNKVQAYRNYITEEMTGMRTTSYGAQGYVQYVPTGVADHFAVVNKMTPAKRDELARALGVDAIVSVVQHMDIDQPMFALGNATGDAKFTYTTRSSLMAYTPGTTDPVWQVSNIKGQEVSSEKFEKQTRLSKMSMTGMESSASSTSALAEKYTR